VRPWTARGVSATNSQSLLENVRSISHSRNSPPVTEPSGSLQCSY